MTVYRLIKALRTGSPPDIDVYDGAAWSCITELSEKSVANRSRPMDFPTSLAVAGKRRRLSASLARPNAYAPRTGARRQCAPLGRGMRGRGMREARE